MKKKLRLIFIALYFFCVNFVQAQWQVLNGPYGFETNSTVFLDSLCFSGTLRGLAVSNDGGNNWSYLNTGINGSQPKLEFNEGKLIFDRAYNTSGGIISLDSGRTWNTMTSLGGFPPNKYEVEGGKIYAWCEYGFLFYSADNGGSWNPIIQPPSTNNINCISADNGRLYVSKSSFGSGSGNMYFTDDLGATWDSLSLTGMSGSNCEVYQMITNGNQLFIVDHFEIYKSIDGGNNWSSFNTNLPSNHTTRIFLCDDELIAAIDYNTGLFRTDTSAANFLNINTNMPLENKVTDVFKKNGILYASSSGGLFKTNETTINWELSQNGILYYDCNSIEALGENIFFGSYKNFYVSHNNGIDFNSIPMSETTSNIYINGSEVYTCGASGITSSDSGHTWTSINFPYGYYNQNLTDFCKSATDYYALNVDGIVKHSSNNGASWSTINVTPTTTVVSMTMNGNTLFLGTTNGIYRSTNNGVSWNIYLPQEVITKLKVENGITYALSNYSVFYSTNGTNWINTNYPSNFPVAFTVKDQVLVVSPGIYYTNNFGLNWYTISVPVNPTFGGPYGLCLTDEFLFAGYYDSLYRIPANYITSNKEINLPNDYFTISPNPVENNLQLSVKSNFSGNDHGLISITDELGRILLFKEINLQNENKIDLNVDGLSKGIYFISLTLNGEKTTKKFLKE